MMPKLRRTAMESEICSAAAALVFFVTSLTAAFSKKRKRSPHVGCRSLGAGPLGATPLKILGAGPLGATDFAWRLTSMGVISSVCVCIFAHTMTL